MVSTRKGFSIMTATIYTHEYGVYTLNTKTAELVWQGLSEFGIDDYGTENRLIEWQYAPDNQGVKHLLDWAVEHYLIAMVIGLTTANYTRMIAIL